MIEHSTAPGNPGRFPALSQRLPGSTFSGLTAPELAEQISDHERASAALSGAAVVFEEVGLNDDLERARVELAEAKRRLRFLRRFRATRLRRRAGHRRGPFLRVPSRRAPRRRRDQRRTTASTLDTGQGDDPPGEALVREVAS